MYKTSNTHRGDFPLFLSPQAASHLVAMPEKRARQQSSCPVELLQRCGNSAGELGCFPSPSSLWGTGWAVRARLLLPPLAWEEEELKKKPLPPPKTEGWVSPLRGRGGRQVGWKWLTLCWGLRPTSHLPPWLLLSRGWQQRGSAVADSEQRYSSLHSKHGLVGFSGCCNL